MSAATDALSRGFSLLQEQTGETLTFRSSPITGVVDRAPGARARREQSVDFDARDRSVIEVLVADVDPAPAIGEVFTDADGQYHRTETVQRLGTVWSLECQVSG